MENDAAKSTNASSQPGITEESRARAKAVVQAILEEMPSPDHVRRYRRRHAGFINSYFLTGNHESALHYAQHITSDTHPLDKEIALIMEKIIPKYFP